MNKLVTACMHEWKAAIAGAAGILLSPLSTHLYMTKAIPANTANTFNSVFEDFSLSLFFFWLQVCAQPTPRQAGSVRELMGPDTTLNQ